MVAVKVIEHNESVASRLEGLRESVLSANIQHPNVVSSLTAFGLPLRSSCCEAAHARITCNPRQTSAIPGSEHCIMQCTSTYARHARACVKPLV